MNATMLSILEKRKEDFRVAKTLEEKKQRIEKVYRIMVISWIFEKGFVVSSYTDSTDEVDFLDDIHWWPGVICKDHWEFMLDVNKKITFSEVFVLSRIIKINQLENSHHSPIFLFLHHLPVFHHLPFVTFLILDRTA